MREAHLSVEHTACRSRGILPAYAAETLLPVVTLWHVTLVSSRSVQLYSTDVASPSQILTEKNPGSPAAARRCGSMARRHGPCSSSWNADWQAQTRSKCHSDDGGVRSETQPALMIAARHVRMWMWSDVLRSLVEARVAAR